MLVQRSRQSTFLETHSSFIGQIWLLPYVISPSVESGPCLELQIVHQGLIAKR